MIRRIIHIDEDTCNGCGACADACQEGAIGIVDGKARLLRDDYCDGLGDCLPSCPTGAISFVEREAAAYDEQAVQQSKKQLPVEKACSQHAGGCPGSRMQTLRSRTVAPQQSVPAGLSCSELAQWPCQIRLVPVSAPYFEGARLLIAADCTAYAYAGLHADFMRGRVTLIGCPKLDDTDYSEKLTEIIARNNIQSVTVVRMEVPCCGGLEMAVQKAIRQSGKFLPWQVVTVSIDGRLCER